MGGGRAPRKEQLMHGLEQQQAAAGCAGGWAGGACGAEQPTTARTCAQDTRNAGEEYQECDMDDLMDDDQRAAKNLPTKAGARALPAQ